MASPDQVSPAPAEGPPRQLRILLLTGLGLAAFAFLVFQLPLLLGEWSGHEVGKFTLTGGFWTFLQVVALVGGAIVTGSAVALWPKCPRVLLAAAGIAWLIGNGMDPEWDSARLVMLVLTGVALVAALLISLPYLTGRMFLGFNFLFPGRPAAEAEERGRFTGWVLSRVIVSVLILLHFVGIVASVLSPSAGGRDPSWVAQWIWAEWQPYMQFAYLNNSYRFYSPEPGPPCLLWFYVEYSDGSGRWVKLPDRAEHAKDPLAQEFTRRLTLGESVNQLAPVPPSADAIKNRLDAKLTFSRHRQYLDKVLDGMSAGEQRQRLKATLDEMPLDGRTPGLQSLLNLMATRNTRDPDGRDAFLKDRKEFLNVLFADRPLPLHPDFVPEMQRQLPLPSSQRLLRDYARFVAEHYAADNADAKVVGVKIYRVVHRMLEPKQMADGRFKPTEAWTYLPYYQGEYSPEGRLLDPNDPFLFWMVPIYAWPQGSPLPAGYLTEPLPVERYRTLDTYDYLSAHAWNGEER